MGEPAKEGATSAKEPGSGPPAGRSRAEAIFLGSIVSVSLGAMIVLLVMASRGVFVPSMGIAILAGTGVATLVYAFLGGQGDSFTIQGMKLAGAAAVFAIIIYIVDGRLNDQMKTLIEQGRDQASQKNALSNAMLLIDDAMGAQSIVGGGSVRLREVTSLDGWLEGVPAAEGDSFRATHGLHEGNRSRPDAAHIFEEIFSKHSIHRPVAEVLKMSQPEWEAFLAGLPENKRSAVGGIPFAVLETRASDGTLKRTTVFKGDDLPVKNASGKVEAVLCVERILDTRTRSEEPEVVVLIQGTGPCPARG